MRNHLLYLIPFLITLFSIPFLIFSLYNYTSPHQAIQHAIHLIHILHHPSPPRIYLSFNPSKNKHVIHDITKRTDYILCDTSSTDPLLASLQGLSLQPAEKAAVDNVISNYNYACGQIISFRNQPCQVDVPCVV